MIDRALTVAGWLVVAGSALVAVGLAGIVWRVLGRKRAKSPSGTAS